MGGGLASPSRHRPDLSCTEPHACPHILPFAVRARHLSSQTYAADPHPGCLGGLVALGRAAVNVLANREEQHGEVDSVETSAHYAEVAKDKLKHVEKVA